MILKKLRDKRRWSQEQLAVMAGLSVRTVQRIEAGHKASLESLKAIASVLETDVSMLQKEIAVIDKTTEKWANVPRWLRAYFVGSSFLGVSERKLNIVCEILFTALGLLLLVLSYWYERTFDSGLIVIALAYLMSLVTRAGDRYEIW